MKGNAKRVICLFLAAIIVVTTVGYAPPSFSLTAMCNSRMEEALKTLASPSEAEEIVEEVATPSEAESTGDKATPSEAENPGDKATPSEAVKKFVQVEPEEIPEYYSQVKKAGKRFWKFEDRNGMIQYRDYGYVNGDVEFPLWYEADQAGSVDMSSVNLDEEYYDLAPYLYKSAAPTKTSWSNLSWKLLNDSECIFLFDRKESGSFKNWDHSTYAIWYVNEKEGDEFQNTDLGYFFYGQILNEPDSVEQWYYADVNGNISPMMQFKSIMLMAEAPTTYKLTFDANGGTIYNNETYEKDLPLNTAVSYSDMNTIKSNMKRVGYTFDGWNYQPDGSGSNFYDSTKVTSDTTIYAKWSKNKYTVYFYRNYPIGDTQTLNYKAVYYGDPISSFPDPFPVGLGMEFKGWYLNKYCSGDPVTVDMLMPGETLNLYGKWESFDVTYKMHYGYGIDESTLPTEIKAKSTVVGRDLAKYYFPDLVISSKLYAPGYVDGYWTDTSDMNASGAVIFPEAQPTWYPVNHITDIYLKKYVKRVVFDLYYPPSDYPKRLYNTYPSAIANGTKYGDIIWPKDLSEIMAHVGSGRKFVGLFSDPEQTKQIDLSKPICPPDKQDKQDLVRYAVYLGIANESSKITFKDWDGTVLSELIIPYGEKVVVPETPVRDRYRFIGWDKSYENVPTDTVLTAQYELSSPILTLDANGGGFLDKTSIIHKVKAGDSLDQLLTDEKSNVSRKYYTFDGWYTAATGGTKLPESGNIMPPSTDLTLYARWVKSSCEVIFKDWAGTVLEVQEVPIGGDAVNHIPERTDYEFMGWNRSLTNIRYDTTITATYTLISKLENGYNISFSRFGYNKYTNYVQSIKSYQNVAYLHRKLLPGKRTDDYYLDTDYYNTSRYTAEIDFPNVESDDNNYFLGWATSVNVRQVPIGGLYACQFLYPLRGQIDVDETERLYGFPLFNSRDKVKVREFMGLDQGGTGSNSGLGVTSLYALYLPKDKASLILVNGFKDYYSTFHTTYGDYWDHSNIGESNFTTVFQEDTPLIESISIEDYGSKVNIYSSSKYPDQRIYMRNNKEEIIAFRDTSNANSYWYKTHKLVGYYSEPNGKGKELLGEYTFNKVDDRYYAYWAIKDEEFHVTFKDDNGNVLGSENVIAGEACKNVPIASNKSGYKFIGWQPADSDNNSSTDKIIRDTTFIAAYEKLATYQLILDGNGGTLAGSSKKVVEVSFEQVIDQALKDGKDMVERPRYHFDGWYTDPTGGGKYPESGNKMPDKDLTIYAHWTRSSSEVVFKDWNGSVLDKQEVAIGADALPPTPPERDLYEFTGWDYPTTNIVHDLVLTAQYKIKTFAVPVDADGGSVAGIENFVFTGLFDITPSEIDELMRKFLLDNATKAGFKLGGFEYSDSTTGGVRKKGFPTKIPLTNDLKIYLIWAKETFQVTYKDWNETIIDNQEVIIGEDALPPKSPDRPGYTFTGWDKSSNNIQANTIITAQYTINGYLLTLDGNGGTLEENIRKEQVLSFNQSFDQVLKDGRDLVSRPGYSFDGWYNSASGGSSYSYSGNQMPAANVTLFAHWSPNTYKVTFDPDHVRRHGETTIEEHTFDTGLGILPMPEIYGWKFTGWWTGKNGTGTEVTNDSMVEPEDVVYYGKWQPETYQIRFISKAEQPEGESVQAFTIGLRYDQEFGNLPVPEEKGYTFTGWYDEGNKKVDSQTIFNPDSDAEAKTYHAGWKGNTYQIRFVYKDSDGKPVVKIIDGTYGMQIGTLPSPEKPGYTFAGWFKDNGEEATAGSWVEPGDTDYKAKWIPNKYTIHFKSNLDSMSDQEDKTVTYALPIGDLPLLHATGYVFLGWYTKSSGGSPIKETTLASLGDQTYYGHWSMGLIDNGNGTYRKPGSDGKWNTADDELWWYGPDGNIGTDDDRQIYLMPGGTGYYVDYGNGTYLKPGAGGSWTSGTELWWYGSNGKPGAGDRPIYLMPGGNGYYVDFGNGSYLRPGAGGSWTSGTELWWYGSNGKPGADDRPIYLMPGGNGYYIDNGNGTYTKPGSDGGWTNRTTWVYGPGEKPGANDRQIHVMPGGNGYYIDNGNGTYTKPGSDGSWTNGTETWVYGSGGKPGAEDRQIHVMPGGNGYYIDNGNGTYTKPGSDRSWTDGTTWVYGPGGKPGADDRQIHVMPGGNGYYIDNGDGTYTKPGSDGSWTNGTTWVYGPGGKPGADDRQIHVMPGGNGYYIDNGNGTYTKPGSGGSWTNGTETWVYGPGGKPGAEDRQIHVMPGGNGYYIDNGNGTYTKPGWDGSWTDGTTWVYGPGGKPGADDRQIHLMPGENGYYIDNGNGTYTKPGPDGSWTNGTEHWSSGPDGKVGTSDDKKIGSENVDPEPTNPEPTNPEPIKPESEKREEEEIVNAPVIPVIDSTVKPVVPDTRGTFTVNPNNPLEVTYTKPDGTTAKNEWVGDGKDWYHVDESGNLNYDWYLEGERTWYKLNKEPGDRFGAALIGWNYESMDDKRYFFDPSTTKMLTGWQHIDNKWYYFTKQNESQTYYGSNPEGWKYDPTKPGKPYGSMYQNEITPDGYLVDEHGVWKIK
jgi:uncharacterized repeat protein (TIGR02543 family)